MFAPFPNQQQKIIISVVIALFILAVIGFAAWKKFGIAPSDGPGGGQAPPPLSTTTPPDSPAAGVPPPSLSPAPAYEGEPVHVLEADPEVLKQIPDEIYQKSKAELADLAVKLSENPRQPDEWMRVAFIKRFYHDYIGTRDAYEYLNLIADSDPIPFYNLGSLYGYYLKEPQKAIPKYQAAIQRDPLNTSFYTGFADFYREVMNDPASAEKILLQGLSKAPANANLLIALGALYKAMGNAAQAVEYYEKVLTMSDLVPSERPRISEELERLKKTIGQ